MVKPTYACIFERPGDVSPKRSLPPLKRWMASPASNRGSCIIRDDRSWTELNSLVSHSTQVCPAATIWFLQPKHTHCINQHLCNKLALSCSLITPLTKKSVAVLLNTMVLRCIYPRTPWFYHGTCPKTWYLFEQQRENKRLCALLCMQCNTCHITQYFDLRY